MSLFLINPIYYLFFCWRCFNFSGTEYWIPVPSDLYLVTEASHSITSATTSHRCSLVPKTMATPSHCLHTSARMTKASSWHCRYPTAKSAPLWAPEVPSCSRFSSGPRLVYEFPGKRSTLMARKIVSFSSTEVRKKWKLHVSSLNGKLENLI